MRKVTIDDLNAAIRGLRMNSASRRNPRPKRYRGIPRMSGKMRRTIFRAGRKLYGKTFAAPKMRTAIGSRGSQIRTAVRVSRVKERMKRNPLPAALAVLKASEAAHYLKNPRYHAMEYDPRGGFRTITAADVGKKRIVAFGKKWPVEDFIGRIMKQDIGKRIYLRGDILQVENDDQRNSRMRTNPMKKGTKHIHLQERRGNAWITCAMFPDTPDGRKLAKKIGNQLHRKYPAREYRAFS